MIITPGDINFFDKFEKVAPKVKEWFALKEAPKLDTKAELTLHPCKADPFKVSFVFGTLTFLYRKGMTDTKMVYDRDGAPAGGQKSDEGEDEEDEE